MKLMMPHVGLAVLLSLMCLPAESGIFSGQVNRGDISYSEVLTEETHQEPVISPDGKWLAYMNMDEGWQKRRLWIVGIDSKIAKQIIQDERPQILAYPKWSPDSKQIAFISNLGIEFLLCILTFLEQLWQQCDLLLFYLILL